MPDMDGLQMLQILKEKQCEAKAIVLSAYSEFSYAQQAIKLGVSEYLLKPIAVGELTQSLKNAEIQIEQQSIQKSEQIRSLQKLENIFYGILLGGTVVDAELKQFLEKNYKLNDSSYLTIVPIFLGNQYELYSKRICKELIALLKEKAMAQYRLLENPQNNLLLLILFSYQKENDLKRWFQSVAFQQLKKENQCHACFGWSSFQGITVMKSRFQDLQKHMDWNITLGDDVLITFPQVTQIQTKVLSYPIEIENRMRIALCAMDCNKITKVVKLFFAYFKDGNVYSPKEIKESYVRFLWFMINV
jgi:two-component system response regulator YesN